MRRIAVFARWPETGRVKTRLAAALTPGLAVALYRAMLLDTIDAASRVAVDERSVWWAEPPAGEDADLHEALRGGAFKVRLQEPGDLGTRLEGAFKRLCAHDGDRAIVTGTDCPDLDTAILEAAFDELERADVVLGPARDGGYVLIGLARRDAGLFRGIDWSTDRVLGQTLERAATAGMRVTLMPGHDDVDVPADLLRLVAREAGAPKPGPDAAPVDAGAARFGGTRRRCGARTLDALRRMRLLPAARGT